jgi:predicted nucleotidyltransferase component of viral defense system
MVTGAVAVAVYGRPRPSYDIDTVIKGERNRTEVILEKEDYKPNPEKGENDNPSEFESPNGYRIDLWFSPKIKFEEDKFKRKKRIPIGDYPVCFISPEDLILHKLWKYRKERLPKDIDDIRSVLDEQWDALDFEYLEGFAKVLRMKGALAALEKEVKK